MPSIWWIERLCYTKFAFAVLLFHVGWRFVTLAQLDCIMGNTSYGRTKAWYLDDGTIIRDTLVVGRVLELIMEDGPRRGLYLNVDKTKVFLPMEDPRSRLAVAKSIELMDDVAKINDPQCELPLLRACAGVSKLYFSIRTSRVFERAQRSFDVALCSALERIVTAFGPGFDHWQ
ncbi:hypothetical protein Tco_1430545 [Tanacetum coccineum]